MFTSETRIRIRYAETDPMGFAYYGYYAMYYEVARVESLRQLGMSYRELEEAGAMLPVLENNSTYFSPARYDDEIRIITRIREKPSVRIRFEYDIFKEDGTLIHQGNTLLAFMSTTTRKSMPATGRFYEITSTLF